MQIIAMTPRAFSSFVPSSNTNLVVKAIHVRYIFALFQKLGKLQQQKRKLRFDA